MRKIYLATDHAGFELKEKVKEYLNQNYNFEIIDFGANNYVEGDDYPEFIHKAAQALSKDMSYSVKDQTEIKSNIAFVFGGSGQGEAMIMNRYKGVRCTTYYGGSLNIIRLGREHNDANAISFGARFLDLEMEEVKKSIQIFLETEFSKGRHQKRIEEIDNSELLF